MGMTMDTIKLVTMWAMAMEHLDITNAATFPSWFQVSPLSGAIPEGDSVDLVLSYMMPWHRTMPATPKPFR